MALPVIGFHEGDIGLRKLGLGSPRQYAAPGILVVHVAHKQFVAADLAGGISEIARDLLQSPLAGAGRDMRGCHGFRIDEITGPVLVAGKNEIGGKRGHLPPQEFSAQL